MLERNPPGAAAGAEETLKGKNISRKCVFKDNLQPKATCLSLLAGVLDHGAKSASTNPSDHLNAVF